MLISLSRRLEVPAEIWCEILRNLSQRSLKRVRLVCAELAALARPLLFKSISISPLTGDLEHFLHIIRDAELSRAVEELVYREMHFQARPEYLTRGEFFRLGMLREDHYEVIIQQQLQNASEDEAATAFDAEWTHNILEQILEEYESQAAAMNSGSDFAALKEAFSVMLNLKRIITRDSRPPGISTDTGFEPPSLGVLQARFPASDASLRLGMLSDPVDAPAHGFFTILRALAATGATIPVLVTERTTGFLKQGISLSMFYKNKELHQAYAQGFRHLRMVSLCVNDDGAFGSNGVDVEDMTLSECIQGATNLEHLELSLTCKTHRWARHPPLRWLLPSTALLKLHTLVLEGVPATAKEMSSLLIVQARSLRHLTLWNVKLMAEDLWERVLASLSACERFHLDSFTLKSPKDAEVREHQEIGEVPVRIPAETALRFVNEGGLNPFAKRKWRSEPAIDTDVDAGSEVSDVSDFSVWKDTPAEDAQDIDHDLDGPEYNSDYDTEPDVESDATSDDSDESDVDSAALIWREGGRFV
jgi:hypothetical protein